MKLSDLKSQNEINTDTFNSLPPLHKDVVTDFFRNLDKEEGTILTNFETAVDKTAVQYNVNTDVLYNYFDNEVEAQLGV
ncbi:hypothetical protein OAA20_00325 [bacterium]|jgi:hypothetical protein|nr:hypothetical protein [bacterium]MDB4809627.1 hypothetical protein [bacterium]